MVLVAPAPAERSPLAPASALASGAPRVLAAPPRRAGAEGGTAVAESIAKLDARARQRALVRQLEGGNLPGFLRTLVAVDLEHEGRHATVWVTPDYLAVGSDEDFLRVPLDLPSALRVARDFGCVLPTRKIVDAVAAQARVRLEPEPMRPGPEMRSAAYALEHQRRIEAQRGAAPLGALTAGQKKDVVLTNRLWEREGRIAIYGWHRLNGEPIQPLSIVHGARYADYSHGVRLVWRTAWVDDRPVDLVAALRSPGLAPLFTYEGVLRRPALLLAPD